MNETNIIAVRKKNIQLASQAFAELMAITERILNDDAKANPETYRKLSASDLGRILC